MQKLRAAHPGEILSDEFIVPLGLNVDAVERGAGIPDLSEIVRGNRPIQAETALRLSFYFGTTAEFWLNLQRDFDLRALRRERARQIKKEVQPIAT